MSTPTPDSPLATGPVPSGPVPRPPVRSTNRRAVVLGALGLLVAVLVGLVLLLPDDGGDDTADAPPAATPTAEPTPTEAAPTPDAVSDEELQAQRDQVFAEIVRRDPADPTAIGAADAPVPDAPSVEPHPSSTR